MEVCKFEALLVYKASSKTTRDVTVRNPVKKERNGKQKRERRKKGKGKGKEKGKGKKKGRGKKKEREKNQNHFHRTPYCFLLGRGDAECCQRPVHFS